MQRREKTLRFLRGTRGPDEGGCRRRLGQTWAGKLSAGRATCSTREGLLATFKIFDAFMATVVFPSSRVIPFNTKPGARGAGDLTDIANSADDAVIREALSDLWG